MTTSAATGFGSGTELTAFRKPTVTQPGISPAEIAELPTRQFEVAALRSDGSLMISQHKVPAIPAFENAFAAFGPGMLIATPDGDCAVEDLRPGDRISTLSDQPAKLMWVGTSTFTPADARKRMPLLRVMPDTYGENRPNTFVTMGPAARLLHTPPHLRTETGERRLLTPVKSFVDGVNVINVVPPTPVRLFHLCLDRHSAIRANGMEVESYHPGTSLSTDLGGSLKQRFLAMFPHVSQLADFGPLAYPRAPENQFDADVF